MGVATIIFSYFGGIDAVIWTDVTQLGIYLIELSWRLSFCSARFRAGSARSSVRASGGQVHQLLDFTLDVTKSNTFWAGLIGGAFLTTATHGTDQLMVQRYLCGDSPKEARKALLVSGVVARSIRAIPIHRRDAYVFYTGYAASETAAFLVDGKLRADRVFPHFIVNHLPTGVVGLVIAAIAAAAFTSSLNSQAATTMADFYVPMTGGKKTEAHYLKASKLLTATWAVCRSQRECYGVLPDAQHGRSGARHSIVHQRRDPRNILSRDFHKNACNPRRRSSASSRARR